MRKVYYHIIVFLVCFSVTWYLLGFHPYFNQNNDISDMEQSFGITEIQATELLNVDRPRLLSVYKFTYKGNEYLISSRGGIIRAKY